MEQSTAELLWSLLPHPSSDHVVRLFARNNERRVGDFARNPAEIVRFANASEGMNCYVAPNPTMMAAGIRHKAEDVTNWSWMFIDIDPVETVCDPRAALEEALLWLGEWLSRDFQRRRPLIIDSGRGMQAWIRLDDINILSEGFMFAGAIWIEECGRQLGVCGCTGVHEKTPRKVMSYWLKRLEEKLGTIHGCRLDTSVSDLCRVMRLPGTVNIKTGRMAEFEEPSSNVFRGLASLLITGTPPRVFEESEPNLAAPGTPWQMVYPRLTLKAQKYLMHGKEEPGRHEVLWHTLTKLKETGLGREQALIAVTRANTLAGEDAELPASEIKRVATQVYGGA